MLFTPFPLLPLENNANEVSSDLPASAVEEQADEVDVCIPEPRPSFKTEEIPSEVWAEILFRASSGEIRFGDPLDTTRNVALVCKHLSDVATCTPNLWATVTATREHIISFSLGRSPEFVLRAFVRLLDQAVQRSKTCPFRLLIAPSFPSRSLSGSPEEFFPLFDRLTEARVCESWLAHDDSRNRSVSLPLLQSLDISQHPGLFGDIEARNINTPRLHALSCTGIRGPFNISAPNLTRLSLHICAWRYNNLIDFLSTTPSLSFLMFDRIQLKGPVKSHAPVLLSSLRTIVIIDNAPFPNNCLTSLLAPTLMQLSLCQCQRDLSADVAAFIERSQCTVKKVCLSGKFFQSNIATILQATPELESLQLLRLCRPQEILEMLAEGYDSRMLVPKLCKFTFTDLLCLSSPPGLATFLMERSSRLSQVHIRLWQGVDSHAEDFIHLRTISKQCGFDLVLEGLEQAAELEPPWFLLR